MFKVIPKFKGIKAYEEELAKEEAMTQEVKAECRPSKRKSQEIDPDLKLKSNEKRLKSLKEKLESDKRQQSLVKEAITSGLKVNKRIVFKDDDDIDQVTRDLSGKEGLQSVAKPVKQPKKAKQLFESDSDDNDANDNQDMTFDDIDFNKKINNKNAEKLIELSSRFAHDSRFKIDERFLDQLSDDNEEEVTESERTLNLLEEVLGKKLNKSDKMKDKSKRDLFVSRFDPKNEKSSAFEVNNERNSSKRVSFDPTVIEKEKKKKVEEEVSKEVYYEVSSTLKDSLAQKEEEFSLTKLFNTSEEASDSSSKQRTNEPTFEILDKKSKTNQTRNPFRYDSSSEDENEEEEDEDNSEDELNKSSYNSKVESKPILNRFQFFFDKNDSRFNEDIFWNKELVQKARNETKERQIMIVRAMSVRKRSAKKNLKTELKYQKKFKNSNFKRFNSKQNVSFKKEN